MNIEKGVQDQIEEGETSTPHELAKVVGNGTT